MKKLAAGALLGAALALFAVRLRGQALKNALPEGDQGAILALSLDLRDGSRGAYLEANRHPLVPLVLAPWAQREPGFFRRALALLFVADLLALAFAAYLLVRGRGRGAAALGWLACLPAVSVHLWEVAPEALLAAAVAGGFGRLQRKGGRAAAEAGALFGLGYLLKGTGLLYFSCALAGAAAGGLESAALVRAVMAFGVVASPLLLRNLVVFHQPFFNVNQRIMWLDTWAQYWPLDWTGQLARLNAGQYFMRHSFLDIAWRLLDGTVSFTVAVARAWSPWGTGSFLFFVVPAGWALWSDREPIRRRMTLALFAGSWLAFGWFAKVTLSERFAFPLLPIAASYAAAATMGLWDRLAERTWGPVAVFLVAALLAGGAAGGWRPASPAEEGLGRPEFKEAVGEMNRRFKEGDRIVMDDSDFITWLVAVPVRKACLKGFGPALWSFAEWGGAEHVVLFHPAQGEVSPRYHRAFENGRVALYEKS